MSDAVKDKYLYGGGLRSVEDFDNTYHQTSPSAYEVIRIMNGRPLFLEEHYARLCATLKSIGEEVPFSVQELRRDIESIALANNVSNHNVKIVINEFKKPNGPDVHVFLIATSYPTEAMYAEGVPTDLFVATRNNPQAKIIDADLRSRENTFIKENNLFEVLLVNERNEITEGSRSNTFFIRNGEVFTSPADGVLLGITRQRILRLCRDAGINVNERRIAVSELDSYDAAFISGTSPKVLPISRIGNVKMDINEPLLRRIIKLYDQEIENYNAQTNN